MKPKKKSFVYNKNYKSKKDRRKESKKKKLEALIQIGGLNAKTAKKRSHSDVNSNKKLNGTEGEPERKRLRKDVKYLFNGEVVPESGPPVFNELTEEQKKIVKKLLEERTKKRLDRPFLELTEVGNAADLRTPPDKRVPLEFDDIQNFIIYSLFHGHTTGGLSRWIRLLKTTRLRRRIFVVIEGAGLEEYLTNEAQLTTLKEFEGRFEIATPLSYGGNLIDELASVALTKTQQKNLIGAFGSLDNAAQAGEFFETIRTMFKITKSEEKPAESVPIGPDKFSRKELLLTAWDMFGENYPLPKIERFSDFVQTRDTYGEVTANSPMWSVDCEMCLTTKGSELTRICIIDEEHNIVYETFVKPPNRIVNYLTKFSGITPDLLKNVTVSLEDVQQHIRSICPPDVIWIGQSLNSDLTAMKMIHPYVIDTSLIFNLSGVRHRKTKLRVLTEEFLSERIQTDCEGHSPIEDALAAMKLVQTKLQHSLAWGNAVLNGQLPDHEREAARELLLAREKAGTDRLKGFKEHSDHILNKAEEESVLARPLFSHICKQDKKALLVGKGELLDEWGQYINSSQSVDFKEAKTEKFGVKVVKKSAAIDGITILHISLNSRTAINAVQKADKLVEKLLRERVPNTLYTILLAGRPGSSGNGVLFVHLCREHIPWVTVPQCT